MSGVAIKRITNLQAVSGGPNLAEISGLSIKIKKREGAFTADVVLEHPLYLDITITGASFTKEKAFVFDKNNKAITGIMLQYRKHFETSTSVTFPDQIDGINVEEIKGVMYGSGNYENVFRGGSMIQTIHLPKNLKIIGKGAFMSLQSLTSIKIPQSVTTIGEVAFFNNESLTTVNLPQSVTSIGAYAFRLCSNLTSIDLSSVQTFGTWAFKECGLTSINLSSATSIGTEAFQECDRLTSVTMGNSLQTIGTGAFMFCVRLRSITIPKSVTHIRDQAFRHCAKLTVYIKQRDPSKIRLGGNRTFYYIQQIEVPKGTLPAYQTANGWQTWAYKMLESL